MQGFSKYIVPLLLTLYTCVFALSMYYFNGTGDAGDSVEHYLYARYAPLHPELYFNHWAKPLFVLLASPFAQFGFNGIKVFNCLVTLITILFTYQTALKLQLKNAFLVVLFMMVSPLYYILSLSGLTEPLFALFVALGLYFCTVKRLLTATIIISFLPYVRSEGLIIIGVFAIYLIYVRAWKYLPLLFSGSILYGCAGYFVYHDVLWVITKIPYATMSSIYGSGTPYHFIVQFINVLGVPLYVLFWIGFLNLLFQCFKKNIHAEGHLLILFGFVCFFVAHSAFWYFGIFNSMGLKRVLLGIMPFIGLILLHGFNTLTENTYLKAKLRQTVLKTLLLIYILVFPFTNNPSAIQWKKDMYLETDQQLAHEVTERLLKQKKTPLPLVFNHHSFSMTFGIDYFDPNICAKITKAQLLKMKQGDWLIWDSRYAEKESDIRKEQLDATSNLRHLFTLKAKGGGKEIVYAAYERIN